MSDDGSSLLAGRRVLVTGASGAIGAAIAQRFEAAGAAIVGVDVTGGPDVLACDVVDEQSVAAAFDAAAAGGPLTDVVHSAGIGGVGAVEDVTAADWRRMIDVNLTGSFLIAREAARRLGEGGTLTFISSQAGLRGGARWSAYCASKFGVTGLMQCVAQELAPRGIRVNAVCPGTVETPLGERLVAELADFEGVDLATLRQRRKVGIPFGRHATPHEVAGACVYLASDLASYVVGTSLVLDGGELTA